MTTDQSKSPRSNAPRPTEATSVDLDDHALAAQLATEAGELLLRVRHELGFDRGSRLRDAGDARSHEFLVHELARLRPADAVLSEEGIDDHVRLGADRVWIVDPLDGTREFGEAGRADWAVHVALWRASEDRPASGSGGGRVTGGELVAGAVALPAFGTTLSTDGPRRTPAALPRPVRIVASRSRPPKVVGDVAAALGAVVVPLGSAGAKVAAVVRGEAEVYVHSGGQYEWDSAAPVVVARRAGLHTSRLDGSALEYNRADPFLPDLVVCHPDLAAAVMDVTRKA